MDIYHIDQKHRKVIDEFIMEHWFDMDMVVHGERVNLGTADGLYVSDDNGIAGLVTYRIVRNEFYQKRGFDIIKLHHNSVEEARKIKPQIPLMGLNGIPIKHEIELEIML